MKRTVLYFFVTIFLWLPVLFFPVKAQQGNFFLTHYSPSGKSFDNINFDIVQDHQGLICVANRSGVLRFDGKNWDFIKTPAAIFSLAIDQNNVIYTGGQAGFGRLTRDENFALRYVSLSNQVQGAKNIINVIIKDRLLYAVNDRHVFIYDIMGKHTQVISSKYSGELEDIVEFENEIYVITERSGLQQISGSKLITPKNERLTNMDIKFVSFGHQSNNYIIGTIDDKLYISQNQKISLLNVKDNEKYLHESGMQNALWLSDSLIAISTLKGGIVFINPAKREIIKTVNYQSGLPDNQVFAISTDENQGVWAAHSRGLTRISPGMPFRSYNLYPGLEGKILSARNHGGKLYVGTSLGAYCLDEIKNYREIVSYIKTTEPDNDVFQEDNTDNRKRRRGLFGFLKKRKKKREEKDIPETAVREVYSKKIDRELRSVKYVYKKIEGIGAKTSQFGSDGEHLFCGGLDGLYKIKEGKAERISASPIKYFFISKSNKKIFASTFRDELKVFDYSGKNVSEVNVFDDFRDDIQYIFEDHKNRIWFCSIDEFYWVKMNGDDIESMDEYTIENPYYYETYGLSYHDSVFFVNKNGIYSLDTDEENLVLVKNGENIDRYLKGTDNNIWVRSGLSWKALAGNLASNKLDMLSVFKDITYITTEEKGNNLWVITDHNDLYKVSSRQLKLKTKSYKLFLKDIQTNSEVIAPNPELKFDQQNSQLKFEFIQPEYSGILDIQYQYKLEGLNEEWSDWSSNYNIIDFPYLPEGEYKLHVRSKNLFGTINNTESISFEIIPPYWKQPWFYIFEFCSLSLLLFISIKIKKLGYKYRLLSRLLALLTLIIIIEFIQTMAESEFSLSSPVIDFVIQVIIAIIILPVEGILRKYIFREKDVKVLDFISFRDSRIEQNANE